MEHQKSKIHSLPYIIFGLFSFLLFLYGLARPWESWAVTTVVFGMVVNVGIHLLKEVNKKTKTIVFCIVIWLNMMVCILQDIDDTLLLGMTVAFIVLLSQFDIVGLHYISMVAMVLMLAAHILKDWEAGGNYAMTAATVSHRYLPVFLVEFIELNQLKERLRREKQLQSTMGELKAAEQSKMDFMANVSHELRTPLNGICGLTFAMLEGKEPLSGKTKEQVEQINIAGHQLRGLVSDILDFTELENDTMTIVEEPYNIASVITDGIKAVQLWREEKNLDFILDVDAQIPESLIGDSQKLYRVILSLVNNAFKFTSEGGVIVSMRARKEVYGVNLAIDIRDTGIGIRQQDLERLGAVYNQVDTRRDRQKGGVGLGLAISRKIIAKMNGFMHISSVYGEGTVVSLVIPQRCASEEPMISINQENDVNALYYVDLSKYKNGYIRDAYVDCASHIASGLHLKSLRCHSFEELKRRLQNGKYNYVFTSFSEYLSHSEEFDSIKNQADVIVVVNTEKEKQEISPGIHTILKPFHVFGVAELLNHPRLAALDVKLSSAKEIFYAPQAQVLAVDDVMLNLNVLDSLLQQYQIKIHMAQSGKQALEMLQEKRYDLIFMDHMMPEMDGVDTLHNIRRLPDAYCHSIPVVALTANAVGGAREMLLSEGFDDFVAKPIERSAMERVLKKYLAHCILTQPQNQEREALQKEEKAAREESKTARAESKAAKQEPKAAKQEPKAAKQEPKAASEEPKAAREDLFARLSALPCLDASAGLIYCGGNQKDYLEILSDFIRSAQERLTRLVHQIEQEDFVGYKITVHTLKGMAATIGGYQVEESARALQQLCEEKNYDEVKRRHPQLVEGLNDLFKALGDIMSETPQEKTEKEENETAALLRRLAQAVESFDRVGVLELAEALKRADSENQAICDLAQRLKDCMEEFDFMEAERILSETGGCAKC